MRLRIDPETVKGFLHPDEGAALYAAGLEGATAGPLFEIGSYCGKSALYLGTAARDAGTLLFTLDHHRGSEELQPGWEHHDPDTWDASAEAIDTLPFLRQTLHRADLEAHVVAIVGHSVPLARHWRTPLGLLFIDGGHAMEVALGDWRSWSGHVAPGGMLAIHDVFENPAEGGRPPFEIWRMALASGLFAESGAVRSLRLLRRL